MCGRKQEQYELMFKGLLDYANKIDVKLQPISIMLDFEQAVSNAFLLVFKNSSVLYCHFHYCRSVWRKIQKLGLISVFVLKLFILMFSFYYSIIKVSLQFLKNKKLKKNWQICSDFDYYL